MVTSRQSFWISSSVVGDDNGNPIDTSAYKANSRKAFSGKALVILRSTGSPGTITLTAASSGLTVAPLTVYADAVPW